MSAQCNDSDEALVRKIQARIDMDQSFRCLHDRYHACLYRVFRRRGLSPEDARELTQEVFCRVFKGIEKFRGDSPFNGWLFEISENLFKNEVRRLHAGKRDAVLESLDDAAGSESETSKVSNLASAEPGPWDLLAEKERRCSVRGAFSQLPPQMRRVCILRYCEDRKYREIAVLMGISIETVKAHLHQARKRLSDQVQGTLGPEGES
jgi:RNA polymerase sigma-70 factor (ECF subfamily)